MLPSQSHSPRPINRCPSDMRWGCPGTGPATAAVGLQAAIENGNAECEQTWRKISELAAQLECPEGSQVATQHVIAFNPTNPGVKLTPAREAATRIITDSMKSDYRLLEQKRDFEVIARLGYAYLFLGDVPNAYVMLSIARNMRPDNQSPVFWYALGVCCARLRLGEAATHFQNSLTLSRATPFARDCRLRLAICYRQLSDYEQAIKEFTSLTQEPPDGLTEDDMRFQIAFTYQLAGIHVRAGQIYGEELLKRHPDCIRLIHQHAWFLGGLTEPQAAERCEAFVMRHYRGDDPFLRFVLARMAMRRSDMTRAYSYYRESISAWSDSPLFWCGLAILYFQNDQLNDATVALQRAIQMRIDTAECWFDLGLIYELQGETEKAARVYTTGMQLCNSPALLRDRLQQLQSVKRPATSQMMLDVSDQRAHTQVAEIVASTFVDAAAEIPIEELVQADKVEALRELSGDAFPPRRESLFSS